MWDRNQQLRFYGAIEIIGLKSKDRKLIIRHWKDL
jgi:hypothetical protein